MVFDGFCKDTGGRYGIFIIISAFMIQFTAFGIAECIGLYNIEIMEKFHSSAVAVSFVGAINTGLLMGAGPAVSFLMKKFGYREVAFVGSVLSTVGLVCVPFSPSLNTLYIFYGILTGFGYCMVYIPSHVMSGLYFEKHRSLATGIATSGSGLGMVFLPILIEYLIDYYGWEGSFFIIAGLIVQNCVFSALLKPLPDEKESEQTLLKNEYKKNDDQIRIFQNGNGSPTERKMKTKRTHCNILCDFDFIIYILNNVLWNGGVSVVIIFGPKYSTLIGHSKKSAAQFVMMYGLGTFFGSIFSGILGNIKYFNRLWLYTFSTVVTGLAAFLMVVTALQTFVGFMVLYLVWGCWFGMLLGLLIVGLTDIVGVNSLGEGMGYLMLADGAGCIAGPPLAGLLVDTFGDFDLAFYFSGIITVLSGLVMVLIPIRSWCRPPQQEENDIKISTITIDMHL